MTIERCQRISVGLLSAVALLGIAGCGPQTPPPKVENIVVPLPENVQAEPPPPALPPEPVPPELVNASRGEDLWHLRSALNVAALICENKVYTSLVPNYNRLLTVHKALLTAAVQTELDQFKQIDKKKWQALYDTHMTKLYNQYSLTQQRDKYCRKASQIAGIASDLTAEDLSKQATEMIFRLNLAGEINQALLNWGPPGSPVAASTPSVQSVSSARP
ncbi:MAG: hypothetical protein J7498_15330 [Sphingobium sp.]|nr:hypothetical protein [Sphingobium sp.]